MFKNRQLEQKQQEYRGYWNNNQQRHPNKVLMQRTDQTTMPDCTLSRLRKQTANGVRKPKFSRTNETKDAISKSSVLISPDYSKEFQIFSFALEDTIAGVLLQTKLQETS